MLASDGDSPVRPDCGGVILSNDSTRVISFTLPVSRGIILRGGFNHDDVLTTNPGLSNSPFSVGTAAWYFERLRYELRLLSGPVHDGRSILSSEIGPPGSKNQLMLNTTTNSSALNPENSQREGH